MAGSDGAARVRQPDRHSDHTGGMAESIAEEKSRLRRELRALRRGISETERQDRTDRLWPRVLDGLDRADRLRADRATMAFYGFDDEPRTDLLHEHVWGSGGRLLLPRVEGSTIVAVAHTRSGPLETGVLGVPEPVGRPVDIASIDTVIVPALAFDRQRQRLGYGAGFYDRFLPDLNPDCTVMGVCLDPLLVDRLPVDDHDVPVPSVITDESTISADDAPADPDRTGQ